MDILDLKKGFSKDYPSNLIDQLLETYSEIKRNYFLGNHRPSEVEGGRFAEVVFRLLEHRTKGKHTAIGQQLDTETIIRVLAQLPVGSFPDSIRLHIPRTLRVIYDIRNKRDAAHLADGIDPNLQDTTIVATCADWILAELVRLHHNCSAADALAIINGLVERKAPVVQDFNGTLKTLRPALRLSERLLVLLYHRDKMGASFTDLGKWIKPSQRRSLRATLWNLVHNKDWIFEGNDNYILTRAGQIEVETKRLFDL